MITKVLIANRGEIACRVIKSVQAAGLGTVAVHSDADQAALFVQLADESVALGGNTAAESYLDMGKVIAAAKASRADAIHPGYGFLSENAAFETLCAENNIKFMGPSANAIEVMGNKASAKKLMLESDVPCIPGYQGKAQDDKTLAAEAEKIGYPLMVKAAAGGGGRGIRLVNKTADFVNELKSARKEALNAFGSDEIILEKAIVSARHIEIQVAADQKGNVIHLGDRDCSAQRRHQKVIEEAPSPFMTETLRDAMGLAAVNAAKAVNYEGVGTVEFLVDADGSFYFLEMNTRLQVEHPVTEMITGVDLVDWQIKIANGFELPLTQAQIELKGHAIEVRIYAEDPANDFMPQTGVLREFKESSGEGVRTDHGVYSGSTVSPYYDSMLAKLICWGNDREEARVRLLRALKTTKVLGLTTNKGFLTQLLNEDVFIKGEADTGFINEDILTRAKENLHNEDLALAVLAIVLSGQNGSEEHGELSAWSNGEALARTEVLSFADKEYSVKSLKLASDFDQRYALTVGDETLNIEAVSIVDRQLHFSVNDLKRSVDFSISGDQVSLDLGERVVNFERVTYKPAAAKGSEGSGKIAASTEGLIIDVLVKPGDKVKKGDTLIVVEAMKMEHRHLADGDGEVLTVNAENGQQVKNKQLLIELELIELESEGEA